MILPIITYPTPTGVEFAPDVRFFDEDLFTFIENLKETANASSLDALCAAQVGNYYNVIVYKETKDASEYKELINPRIIKKSGEVQTTEYSAYFPNIPANMKRYEKIKIIYEDRNGEQQSLNVEGDLSILLQRKMDFLHGANYLILLKGEEREKFENLLLSNGLPCEIKPKGFNRDYFVKAARAIAFIMVLIIVYSFIEKNEDLWQYQVYLALAGFATNIIYILYSYYQNKRANTCTNCFNLSFLGVAALETLRIGAITLLSYFLL